VPHRVTDGRDVTLIGIGNTVRTVLAAARALATWQRTCQVVDLRTAAPLDHDRLAELAATTSAVVLVDEAPATCSLMHDIACRLMQAGAVAPDRIRVLSGAACPAPVDPASQLVLSPSADDVVEAVLGAFVKGAV
jgi:pyruvate/2-oxoglutarate/acetoin dehydrogenase E1 component